MRKVMLVARDLALRNSVQGLLEELGFNVDFPYHYALEALIRLRRHAAAAEPLPDLIVCEATTDIMSGYELHEKMVQEGMTIPFVILSDRFEFDRLVAQKEGINAVVDTQPLVLEIFKQAVTAALVPRPPLPMALDMELDTKP